MDDNAKWMAAGLFSPSKARQQEALAKDWLFVDDWLRQQYTPARVPTFERNEETLQALMDLMSSNEQANERNELIEAVHESALSEITVKTDAPEICAIYEKLEARLDSVTRNALEAIAAIAVELETDDHHPQVIGHRLVQASNEQFDLSQQLSRVEGLRQSVEVECSKLRTQMREITGEGFLPPPDLQEQTAEWNRGAKKIKAKLNEYNDRLAMSNTAPPHPDFDELDARQMEIKTLQDEIRRLADALASFQGLSNDPREAHFQLQDAKAELGRLIAERDNHFENLVDN